MWQKIPCSFKELNLDITLGGGQSFRWTKSSGNEWLGVITKHVYSLKQDANGNLLYCVHEPSQIEMNNTNTSKPAKRKKRGSVLENAQSKYLSTFNHENLLKDYFNLQFCLEDFYKEWSKVDENFKKVCADYTGIRILRQDPVENLFSFICSANNNIPRITSMVEKMCMNYGEKIIQTEDRNFHSFPTVESLAKENVEQELRDLGFGYRAKYINKTAQMLLEKPKGWLEGLRIVPYKEAHTSLLLLSGVGAKVADCICLMSLDKYEAIPVDTHIWQVTIKDYMPHLKISKTLTDKIYQEIGDFYREKFGSHAGWANTVLFASDLKMFKSSKRS